MKPTLLLMAGVAALSLAACDRDGRLAFGPPAMKAVSKLNCPEHSGDLRRVSAAPDGKSCAYVDGDGAEVTLQLVAVSGDPEAALKPIEASLASLVPPLDSKAEPAVAEAAGKDAPKAAEDAAAARAAAASDAAVDASATGEAPSDEDAADVMDEDENVDVDMPGVHVRTRGEKAEVKVFGFQIDADDSTGDDRVQVRHGRGLMVDANHNGAVVRMTNSSRANLKSTVIFKMDSPGPQGHHVVGYVARGPRTGPLVVATVKSKSDDDDDVGPHEGVFSDATRLARRASR